TINAPFAENSTAAHYRMKITIGERWELNEHKLPTGFHQALTEKEIQMKTEGVSPFYESMDHHYTAAPQNGRNRMELTDELNRVTLVYDVGNAYKQWVIWNNHAQPGFFC